MVSTFAGIIFTSQINLVLFDSNCSISARVVGGEEIWDNTPKTQETAKEFFETRGVYAWKV